MISNRVISLATMLAVALLAGTTGAEIREEKFDQRPVNWEGVNNRCTFFAPKTVMQDFGFSSDTSHAGGESGEVGGKINPAGEAAYYGYKLPHAISLDDPISASGKIFVPHGAGHFLRGFFNPQTMNEWRTPNTLVARINGRGEGFHCHAEYCTSLWRCEAGVIGEIVRGRRIDAKMMPCGVAYEWTLHYDPQGADGRRLLIFTLNDEKAECPIVQEHRADGSTFTHFD